MSLNSYFKIPNKNPQSYIYIWVFNLYGLKCSLCKEALKDIGHFIVGERLIKTRNYENELMVLCKREEELQPMLNKIDEVERKYFIKINTFLKVENNEES